VLRKVNSAVPESMPLARAVPASFLARAACIKGLLSKASFTAASAGRYGKRGDVTVDAEAAPEADDVAADDATVAETADCCACATPIAKTQVQATAKATTSNFTKRFMIFSKATSA